MNPKEFDVSAWLGRRASGGDQLSRDALNAVAAFTTMWNMFENSLCDNQASIATFENLSHRYRPDRASNSVKESLAACLAFWQFRYRDAEGIGSRFSHLHFRRGDRQELVEAVLLGTVTEDARKLLALLIIVYRLRNNLFHGLKSVAILNDQVHNLNTASQLLAAVLEAIPSEFIALRFGAIEA